MILQKYHAGITDPNAELTPLVAAELSEITQAIQMQQDASQLGWSALTSTPGIQCCLESMLIEAN